MTATHLAPELEALRRCARRELPEGLRELRARFPDETFYALALVTTRRHDSIALLGASEESVSPEDRWNPRAWTRSLSDLSALSETHDALDRLHLRARGEVVDLSELWIELARELRESGWLRSFGWPALTVFGGARDWREVLEELG